MKNFKTQTGLGYLRKVSNGKIYAKVDLPPGDHKIEDDYEFVEVNSQQELDQIEIDPEPKTEKQQREEMIAQQIYLNNRQMAINSLRAKGKLPQDFEDSKNDINANQ